MAAKKAARRRRPDIQQVAYDMRDSGEVLGGLSTPSVYWLVEQGHLKTFVVGRRRLATVEALEACAQKLQMLEPPLPSEAPNNRYRPAGNESAAAPLPTRKQQAPAARDPD